MIVRRCLTFTVSLWLIFSAEFGGIRAERWSRQVANSEWIPLANPRASHNQAEQTNPGGLITSGAAQVPQIQSLALPPALQHQYQQQLLQLQKTQENIQKLLLLQQQLRTQQQLLQSQAFLPSGFDNPEDDKQLHEGALSTSQQLPDLGPEVLVPPLPPAEALPPVFPPQSFHHQRPNVHQPARQSSNIPQEFTNVSNQDYRNGQTLQQEQNNADIGNIDDVEDNQRQGAKRLKDSNDGSLISQSTVEPENVDDEEEEVQLVYVPAETLAQRGQPKRGRGRKQYNLRQQQQQHHQHQQQQHQQQRESQGIEQSAVTDDQDTFARQLLQQIQMEHEEKAQFLKEERLKEIARLNEEQRALDRKARLQQEALQREQELQRQREAEKKKKELERLEELAKQRELEKIREAREKQRLEELERRRLAEIRAKEERRREQERQKDMEIQRVLKQQSIVEKQRPDEVRATSPTLGDNHETQAQALPLIREQQLHRQHLTETSKPAKSKVRGRQRHQYQNQPNYRETTTPAPSPNQPPLSVYMGTTSSKPTTVKISDVLKILKDAKTIAVLDNVGPGTPQVFVGPTNLDPPIGYAKFDLPYLSSIDHNRVERKVDKLPFFVAPLSFDPPPGYSKIPFPAPHIGSVVVNTVDNSGPREIDDQDPSPTPLIEPNSYIDGLENNQDSTTPSYNPQTNVYTQESSSTAKYEHTYSSTPTGGGSGSRFRFRQFYNDNKPPSVVSTSYYEDQRPTTRKHKYYDEDSRVTTESTVQTIGRVTPTGRGDQASYSTASTAKSSPVGPQDISAKEQDLAAQLALINQELEQHREAQRYDTGERYQSSAVTTGLSNSFDTEIPVGDINDVRAPLGPTQYNLPAELPAISPQLPGLVNSLLDKQEAKLQAASAAATSTTSTTTTTTTTARTPTTTNRPRGRQRNRVVPTRPRTTTQAPSTRANVDRSRRPYSRSRSRFTTTTEEYRESSYEPTKARIQETTLKYNGIEQRRPTSRTQKYRSRDKTSHQSEVHGQGHNVQTQQSYDKNSQSDAVPPPTAGAFLQPTGPETTLRQQDPISPSSNPIDYTPENYPTTTTLTTENYPSLHGSSLTPEDYSRTPNYPQNHPQDVRYRDGYDQGTLEGTGLEKSPVNGFNYQVQNEEALEQVILQRPKEYPQQDGGAETGAFDFSTTEDPRLRTTEEQQQRYTSIYEVNVPQTQPDYGLTGQGNFQRIESEKIQAVGGDTEANEQPIFVPLPRNKQEDYELQISSTETPLTDVTTETTTTSTTPVIIRQRVRARLGGRGHHEPTVQTRPRGSQDEYVRFNAVNHESTRSSTGRHREGSRSRPRNRGQAHGSQAQTEGNDYVKIHHQRPIATTTPPPTTTPTTTTTVSMPEEDADYGFIRPPNFRPVHPVDNRFHAPVTYRPPLPEMPSQSFLPNDETALDTSPQSHLVKNRQKYQPAPNRRLHIKSTSLPSATSTTETTTTSTESIPVATALPDDTLYAPRPKSRTEETKATRARGRVRRPGKKRVTTTTTTESILEAHNELPLDENYPRISPQLTTTVEQRPTYDENNYEGGTEFSSVRNRPTHQFYETTSENYPPQFVLNFGNHPEQPIIREEYDQTQLASTPSRKYSHSARDEGTSDDSQSTLSDIYGAESQWSTKLTRTSFQPSFASNRVPGETSKSRHWLGESEREKNAPEIITAAPEVSSVTLVVSSDVGASDGTGDLEESMLMGTTMFGRKTNSTDRALGLNATNHVTGVPTTRMQERNENGAESTYDAGSWLTDRVENPSEEATTIDFEKLSKKSADPVAVRKGTRRRRVRVRVRPAVDDFVTAESQHFNSAVNSLFQDRYKYNPIRESKLTTLEPITRPPQQSVLQDFLAEILKSGADDASVQMRTTSTELPEDTWTMPTAMTTPLVISDDPEETTLKESQATTIVPTTTVKLEETTTIVSRSDEDTGEKKETMVEKEDKDRKLTRKGNWAERTVESALSHESLTQTYESKENDINKLFDSSQDGSGNAMKLDLTTKQLSFPDNGQEMETFSKIVAERENMAVMSREVEESKKEESYGHHKNHRAKWSEVRYPSSLDHPQGSSWSYDGKTNSKSAASIPGLIAKNENEDSAKTITDYVKAIFDTMKSAEEEASVTETEKPADEITTTVLPLETETGVKVEEDESSRSNKWNIETTSPIVETTRSMNDVEDETRATEEATTTGISAENSTIVERLDATTTSPEIGTNASSADEPLTTDSPTTTVATATSTNSTESMLGKVVRTSTTTKVSHMTEICYRGRCVMTRPKRDDRLR